MISLILVFIVGFGYIYVMNRYDKKYRNYRKRIAKQKIIEKYWNLFNLLDLDMVMELFKMRIKELQDAER